MLKIYIKSYPKTGFIWLSKSLADALILFDKKPNRSLWLCIDYQRLNILTIKNRYPLLLIGKFLDWLGHTKQFTQLDLTNAYYWIRFQKDDEWKTAFRTKYGHFEYQVMPFNLSNTPASFQGYINKILAKKLDILIIVYLDNILIYIENPGQPHVDTVRWVLKQLRRPDLFDNWEMCRFHQDKVRFLGFGILAQGISIEEERIEAVNARPEPKSIRDFQVFLRFANFFWHFIQSFSKIAGPLISMLKTTPITSAGAPPKTADDSIFLTSEAKLAFSQLGQIFTKALILYHFDPERYIRIETDVSGYAISSILSQINPESGQWHPIAFFSRKMIPAGSRYKTHNQELLEIVNAFKTWHHYLEGCKYEVLVLTDYNNLL